MRKISDQIENLCFETPTETFTGIDLLRHAQGLQNQSSNSTFLFGSDLKKTSLLEVLSNWVFGSILVPISKDWSKSRQSNLSNILHDFTEKFPSLINSTTCVIQTSGTTAEPKTIIVSDVMLEPAQLEFKKHFLIDKNDTWLNLLPLHHIGGLSVFFRALKLGYSVKHFFKSDINQLKEFIESGEIQFTSLVPTQLKRLMDLNVKPSSNFKQLFIGGGHLSKGLLKKSLDAGFTITYGYGMTETAAMLTGQTYKPGDNIDAVHVGQSDFENAQLDLKSTNNDGSGIIHLKGNQLVDTYYSNGKWVQRRNEWFNTGDIGKINSQGKLEILMRRTDRIKSGGENINPIQIEEILNQHVEIKDSAVVGIPDSEWGEKVVCLIEKENKSLPTHIQVYKNLLKSKLEPFMIPKSWHFVDEIPRISIQKIDRIKARNLAIKLNQHAQK